MDALDILAIGQIHLIRRSFLSPSPDMATRQRKDFIFRCAYFQRGFRSFSLLLAVVLTLTSSLPSVALKQEAAPEGASLEELSRRIQKTAPAAAALSAGLEESSWAHWDRDEVLKQMRSSQARWVTFPLPRKEDQGPFQIEPRSGGMFRELLGKVAEKLH